MADDPLSVRDHLALACDSLAVSKERTGTLLKLVRALERAMADGDTVTALYGLPTIIADLGELKTFRPGVAGGTAKLRQDPEKVLLPGVADAIEHLRSALTLLNAEGQK